MNAFFITGISKKITGYHVKYLEIDGHNFLLLVLNVCAIQEAFKNCAHKTFMILEQIPKWNLLSRGLYDKEVNNTHTSMQFPHPNHENYNLFNTLSLQHVKRNV